MRTRTMWFSNFLLVYQIFIVSNIFWGLTMAINMSSTKASCIGEDIAQKRTRVQEEYSNKRHRRNANRFNDSPTQDEDYFKKMK